MRTLTTIHEALRPDSAISAYGTARSTVEGTPLSPDELRKIDAYWRASLYLCLGMLYLKANPLAARAAELGAHKAAAAGSLGLGRRPGLHLHPLQPADQKIRPQRDLHQRPRARGARRAVPGVSRRHLFRDLSGKERRRGGTAALLQAVLVSRRHRQSRHAGNARAASTRAANSATASRTPMARSTTTRT